MAHTDRILWDILSENPSLGNSSELVALLMAHTDRILWDILSVNPSLGNSPELVGLLMAHSDCIGWSTFSRNESIFGYDYETIKKHGVIAREAIAAWFNHPRFVRAWAESFDMS